MLEMIGKKKSEAESADQPSIEMLRKNSFIGSKKEGHQGTCLQKCDSKTVLCTVSIKI